MTTFWDSVMGLFSTPTNAGDSRIEDEYITGTQEEWQHQCPKCKEWHLVTHRDMHTDYDCSVDKREQGRLSLSQLFGVVQIAGLGLQKLKCGRPHKNILHRTLRLSLRGYGAFLLTVLHHLG